MSTGVICCTELIYLLKAAMLHLRFVCLYNVHTTYVAICYNLKVCTAFYYSVIMNHEPR